MNCEGEGAPTRQNIKSHLQKYRLLMQKRAKQGGGGSGGDGSDSLGLGGLGGGSGGSDGPSDFKSELEQHLARQEMNLRVQMDLQTKLHRQLLVQRQLQHQLEHCFPPSTGNDRDDRQRYHATLSLKNSLRERLTTHVMLQQEMLQHLDALVSSEGTKLNTKEDGSSTTSADGSSSAADGSSKEPSSSAPHVKDESVSDSGQPQASSEEDDAASDP